MNFHYSLTTFSDGFSQFSAVHPQLSLRAYFSGFQTWGCEQILGVTYLALLALHWCTGCNPAVAAPKIIIWGGL